jgi:hypothetical protein
MPSTYKYIEADKAQGELFKKAEEEMKSVAKKYGFHIRLIDNSKGTWYFYPEVDHDWEPNKS